MKSSQHGRVGFLSEVEEKKILTQVCENFHKRPNDHTSKAYAVVSLSLFLGLKKKEMANLKVGNVFLGRGKGSIAMNGHEYPFTEYMSNFTKDYLCWKKEKGESLGELAPLVCSQKGNGFLSARGWISTFQSNMDKLDVTESISATYTVGFKLVRMGYSPSQIKSWLGYSMMDYVFKYYQDQNIKDISMDPREANDPEAMRTYKNLKNLYWKNLCRIFDLERNKKNESIIKLSDEIIPKSIPVFLDSIPTRTSKNYQEIAAQTISRLGIYALPYLSAYSEKKSSSRTSVCNKAQEYILNSSSPLSGKRLYDHHSHMINSR